MNHHCNLCGHQGPPAETALVPCNIRAFLKEQFPVWRCAGCQSIHAAQDVDLPHYYARYPFQQQRLTLMYLLCYDQQLRRLRRAGMGKEARLLDYGCGSGLFVEFLKTRGYPGAVGYDAYNPAFQDPTLLQGRYDAVLCQDVVEHVEDPLALLQQLRNLCQPQGLLAIGTPNASAISLHNPGAYRHALHQPYHRHILSKTALLQAGDKLGLTLVRYYPRQYSNTPWPFLNQRFSLYYARCFDDTLDLAFDGPRHSLKFLSPQAFFYGFLGYFLSEETDVMALWRLPPLLQA